MAMALSYNSSRRYLHTPRLGSIERRASTSHNLVKPVAHGVRSIVSSVDFLRRLSADPSFSKKEKSKGLMFDLFI
jgi:hypothetical protein